MSSFSTAASGRNHQGRKSGDDSSDEEGEVIENDSLKPSAANASSSGTKKSVMSYEDSPSLKSKLPTPNPTSCDDATSERRGRNKSQKLLSQSIYGRPVEVESTGNFPAPGATLGPWFCLGQLGKGTFSSIHKVIHMAAASEHDHDHAAGLDASTRSSATSNNRKSNHTRLAAAKVELTSFQQSGVLESEAAVLDFLHRSLQHEANAVVPKFFGYFRCTTSIAAAASSSTTSSLLGTGGGIPPTMTSAPTAIASALVMEYLPGQDMHQLREAVMTHPQNYANNSSHTPKDQHSTHSHSPHHQHHSTSTRRIELEDAVYLTAEVMLPLLRHLHSVGVVHRDVKPSNCVLRRAYSEEKGGGEFCMVDFGLSKSIVVPEDSPHADKQHYWPESRPWQKPSNYHRRGCFRTARERAEFRGTSMYASLRVHQLNDYCPRDDMWSLMYVFCDLVSGGLPWMQQAANRDRAACQQIKEKVHGDGDQYETDETELLLMGDCYHVAKFRKDRYEAAAQAAETNGGSQPAPPSKSIDLPPPLPLSKDPRLVDLLRAVFSHLGKLEFWDTPDYDLIQRNIRCFTKTNYRPPPLPRISYEMTSANVMDRGLGKSNLLDSRRNLPRGCLPDDSDPLDGDLFDNVDDETEHAGTNENRLRRLPLELQYRLLQMEYHASRPDAVPMALALRDWMKVTLPLLYGEWDTPKYEGRHRTSTDGLKRELFLELLKRCLAWAAAFDNFRSKNCYPTELAKRRSSVLDAKSKNHPDDDPSTSRMSKRSRVDASASTFITVSRALFGLKQAIQAEQAKKSGAQATRITFS